MSQAEASTIEDAKEQGLPAEVEERRQARFDRFRLEFHSFGISVGAFGLGAVMAVMQALSRADIPLPFRSEQMYYVSVTAHGVLLALVFTTFFIMGLGYLLARTQLGRVEWEGFAWISHWTAVFGSGMTAVAILSGSSTVLYTFYPPLQAHWSFYVGATLLVIGSWGWCAVMLRTFVVWRGENPDAPTPLAFHGMVATVLIWILATSGLAVEVLTQLIPWSLGLIDTVDPIVARTWFWWFGHPLTYFWLVPAYVVWYTIMPRHIGGRLFSDYLGRVVFVLFIVFSTPVGFHHQFSDPGIDHTWKLLHTVTTYAVMFPSLVTAFTIVASIEVAGRLRSGDHGSWLAWLKKLPWKDPLFASVFLAMVTFGVGGFGGAINAAYAMNTMVHNTAWIMGHFHLTVGTATALTFMGVAYWILPRIVGRELAFRPLAIAQPYLWFLGMILFAVVNHWTGILGMPRRVFSGHFQGSEIAAPWRIWTVISAYGGIVLFISSLFFVAVMLGTLMVGKKIDPPAFEYAIAVEGMPEKKDLWDRFGLWFLVAVVLVIIAYAYPIYHLYSMERFGSPGFKPF